MVFEKGANYNGERAISQICPLRQKQKSGIIYLVSKTKTKIIYIAGSKSRISLQRAMLIPTSDFLFGPFILCPGRCDEHSSL
jgi:hypothetical protein